MITNCNIQSFQQVFLLKVWKSTLKSPLLPYEQLKTRLKRLKKGLFKPFSCAKVLFKHT